jgi:hypothetical protein
VQPVLWVGTPPALMGHHHMAAALNFFPLDDRFRTVAMHTVNGVPMLHNTVMGPEVVVRYLLDAKAAGAWDGKQPLQFAACGLGYGLAQSYVAQVMKDLWNADPTIEASAYAGTGPVWFVPKLDPKGVPDYSQRGDLVVAHRVGVTTSGRPGISPGGYWYRFDRPTDGTGIPAVEKLGAHLLPTGDSAPRPQGYFGAKHDEFDDKRDVRGAVPFLGGGSQPELADQIYQELMK